MNYSGWNLVLTFVVALLFGESRGIWPFTSVEAALDAPDNVYPDTNARRVAIIGMPKIPLMHQIHPQLWITLPLHMVFAISSWIFCSITRCSWEGRVCGAETGAEAATRKHPFILTGPIPAFFNLHFPYMCVQCYKLAMSLCYSHPFTRSTAGDE